MRTPVCYRINKGIKLDAGDKNKIVDGIPPTNRWADGTNEPRVRVILKVLCGA